ncbi:glycosyltransferase family 2 protein [Aureispira anguillae]|uniref:Glycosyltransferase family 2 protein n=1 Tax=Aureispira anguillae TaxID=2864201 RepID=A0A916DUV8_9BACT|nr:glycosyltransferase family 2 protein [Aureispira anguillae]BDS12566.1 glycosyltransferase family 2 protein [Aureispira anguillae]
MSLNISIVIPLLNESESLPELEAWIRKVMEAHQFSYEVIFVDDGSTDNSWDIIQNLTQLNPNIKGIKFRRNYGKSAGLNEGFKAATGDVVFTMDADLQDSPDELPEMYRMVIEDGYDLVSGWKKKRFDSFIKNNTSKIYNWTTRKMSGIQLHGFNCGLKAYRKAVVKNIEVYGEMHRYIPVIANNAGFTKIGEKAVKHQARIHGTTKFGSARFIRGPLDLLSIMFVGRFGKRPMHLFGLWGGVLFMLGFFSAAVIGIYKLYYVSLGKVAPLVTNSPYFYIALTCMIMGTQLFLAGFLAELVARNAPNRNKYGVDEFLGL